MSFASSAEIPSTTHPTFLCLAAYAKTKGIKDPAFDSVEYDTTKDECVQLRHKFISNVRNEIRDKITKAQIHPKYTNCIYEKLTANESFVNSMIKAAIYEYSGVSEPSGEHSTVRTVLDYIKTSVVACKSETDFGEEFDSIFETEKKSKKNVTDYQEEYCVKKYLIKNNLIDTVMYNVEPNPHSINVTGLNCADMIKKFNDDIYEELGFAYLETSNLGSAEKVDCALEKFREADYFDLMMKVTAITTFEAILTPEQRSNERENFIRILAKISSNIAAC